MTTDPSDDTAPMPRLGVPAWLTGYLERLEHEDRLDAPSDRLQATARRLVGGTRGAVLRGEQIGHALHPLMTDFPLGCWMAALLTDLVGPRGGRRTAQRLVALGLLASVPTALTGLAEYEQIRSPRARRVGAVHAIGNVVVTGLFASSWRARRRGHHVRGVAVGLLGGAGAWATGYLGGHLSFARRVGTGERGMQLT